MRNWFTRTIIAAAYDRKAISAMEYAILAAAVLGAVGAAMSALGSDITAMFNGVENIITKYTP